METVYDVLVAYSQKKSDADFKQVRTALLRYVIPGWGGPAPFGLRMKEHDIQIGMSYLKKINVGRLADALKVQEQVFNEQKASHASRRNYRYHLSCLINYYESSIEILSISNSTESKAKQKYRFHSPSGQSKERPGDYHKRLGVKQDKGETLALRDEELNPLVRQQLADYKIFRLKELRLASFKREIPTIKRVLGWLHHRKGIPIDELTLESIVPFKKIHYREIDFLDQRDPFQKAAVAEKKAIYEANLLAKSVVDTIDEYKETASTMKGSAAASMMTVLIGLAKWIYRNETEENFLDIPILVQLRNLSRKYHEQAKQEGSRIPYSLKSVPWQEMFRLLKVLKFEADTAIRYRGVKRTQAAVAESVQRLLVVSFFVAMPPRRPRVIAELEVGRTLQRGRVNVKEGMFIPESLLKPGEEVKWCIVLGPKDYKTGKIYGRQSFEVNNLDFEDGTTLYSYLDSWLSKYRSIKSSTGNNLFVIARGKYTGFPATTSTVRHILENTTLRILGRPIPPKELRKMFVSYISNRPDISEADLEAAARAMGHSREMQMNVYDQVTSETRLAAGMELAQRLWIEGRA